MTNDRSMVQHSVYNNSLALDIFQTRILYFDRVYQFSVDGIPRSFFRQKKKRKKIVIT